MPHHGQASQLTQDTTSQGSQHPGVPQEHLRGPVHPQDQRSSPQPNYTITPHISHQNVVGSEQNLPDTHAIGDRTTAHDHDSLPAPASTHTSTTPSTSVQDFTQFVSCFTNMFKQIAPMMHQQAPGFDHRHERGSEPPDEARRRPTRHRSTSGSRTPRSTTHSIKTPYTKSQSIPSPSSHSVRPTPSTKPHRAGRSMSPEKSRSDTVRLRDKARREGALLHTGQLLHRAIRRPEEGVPPDLPREPRPTLYSKQEQDMKHTRPRADATEAPHLHHHRGSLQPGRPRRRPEWRYIATTKRSQIKNAINSETYTDELYMTHIAWNASRRCTIHRILHLQLTPPNHAAANTWRTSSKTSTLSPQTTHGGTQSPRARRSSRSLDPLHARAHQSRPTCAASET